MKKQGFTLVELLAVIAILAILIIIALPNIMSLFNSAKENSFITETKKIFDTAHQQWMSDSMFDTQEIVYARTKTSECTKSLKLSGRSEINYYIKINKAGNVTEYYTEDGTYQYSYNGTDLKIEDIDNVTQIATINPNEVITISCDGVTGGSTESNLSSITYISRQNEGRITAKDEVAIGTEHFYVVSSDETNTVLLAKYNLLVGEVYIKNENTWSLSKTLSPSDEGYGLQNASARGDYGSYSTDRTGVVAFAGRSYWDNADYKCNGKSCGASGTPGLKSEYSSNGESYSPRKYPNVYNSSMSTIAPQYFVYYDPWRYAQDNGYTIAYYVENYVNTLKRLGAPSTTTGRLLTIFEADGILSYYGSQATLVKGYMSFWLGSAYYTSTIFYVGSGGSSYANFYSNTTNGVRPVIVVPTSAL